MALILRYFTEFVYDVAVKQLPRFQNLLLKVIDHIKTICAIIQLLFRQNKLITRFDGRRCIQGFIQAPSGGNFPQTSEIPPNVRGLYDGLLQWLQWPLPQMCYSQSILVHGQVTIIFVVSVCLFVCAVFLSRLWSDFDQTRTHVICLRLVVSPRI